MGQANGWQPVSLGCVEFGNQTRVPGPREIQVCELRGDAIWRFWIATIYGFLGR